MSQTTCTANAKRAIACAVIAQGGNISSTNNTTFNVPFTTLKTVNQQNYSHPFRAVSAASSGNVGIIRPLNNGAFATMQPRQFIMQIAGTHIANVATNQFKSPSNLMRQAVVNSQRVTHTVFLTGLSWSRTGDGHPTYVYTDAAQAPDWGADNGQLNSQLVYRTGAALPKQANLSVPYST